MPRKLTLALAVVCAVTSIAATEPDAHSTSAPKLSFSQKTAPVPQIQRSTSDDPYLTRMREQFGLDRVVAGTATDYEAVRALSKWVRTRWEHNGTNQPQRSDPISILEEAAQGKQFRCVEYSIVLTAALNSVGIPARTVGLMTADAATRESGAGHVVTEAYLSGLHKWIMVDGQWDAIPTLDEVPLNAVEFQRALASGSEGLGLVTFSATDPAEYFAWIAPYLYYFHTALDARYPSPERRDRLFLAPLGAKELSVFQRKFPIGPAVFTHSVKAFYAEPASRGARSGWL